MTEAVKVVPKIVTPEMEAAFTRVMDGPCPETPIEGVQLLFDAVLAASPASDYVAVSKADAHKIERMLDYYFTKHPTDYDEKQALENIRTALKEAE